MRGYLVVERSVFLLAYGPLHGLSEQSSGREGGISRTPDTHTRSEHGLGRETVHGRLRLAFVMAVLKQFGCASATNCTIRRGYEVRFPKLTEVVYTYQTVYDILQISNQFAYIRFYSRWHMFACVHRQGVMLLHFQVTMRLQRLPPMISQLFW